MGLGQACATIVRVVHHWYVINQPLVSHNIRMNLEPSNRLKCIVAGWVVGGRDRPCGAHRVTLIEHNNAMCIRGLLRLNVMYLLLMLYLTLLCLSPFLLCCAPSPMYHAFSGFVAFVMSLQMKHLKYQFSQFAYCHMALLVVVAQSTSLAANLFSGLLWFVLPCGMVVCNDCFAYIFGKLFGRTVCGCITAVRALCDITRALPC